MTANAQTITTKSGREIRIEEAGRPDGVPLLVLHGTPGSRLLHDFWDEDARACRIRLIGHDRPGYGGSTARPGRAVADAAEDVREIASALGLTQLLVWGHSGGGPHALACAALLPGLVPAVAATASPAPFDAPGLDWFAGMGEDNVEEFGAAVKGREALDPYLANMVPGMLKGNAASLVQELRTLLCPADIEVLTEHVAEQFIESTRAGLLQRKDGWVDDDLAFIKPWGFEPSQIRTPLLLMQGAQDKFVPLAHGQWLADEIPHAEARLLPEDGHLTISVRRFAEIQAWLLDKMN